MQKFPSKETENRSMREEEESERSKNFQFQFKVQKFLLRGIENEPIEGGKERGRGVRMHAGQRERSKNFQFHLTFQESL